MSGQHPAVLDETVKRPLTEELLFGQLEHGGTVTVDGEGGEVVLRYAGKEEPVER